MKLNYKLIKHIPSTIYIIELCFCAYVIYKWREKFLYVLIYDFYWSKSEYLWFFHITFPHTLKGTSESEVPTSKVLIGVRKIENASKNEFYIILKYSKV